MEAQKPMTTKEALEAERRGEERGIMQTEIRVINGKQVVVACEYCPVCGEYSERTDTGEYIVGRDCGHLSVRIRVKRICRMD